MLKSDQDAFGQALWAYQNGEIDACAVTERDDGYVNAVPTSFYFSKFEDWPEIEQKAISFAKGKVLDVGCGAGRVALYLQDKGFDVLGIDISPLALEVCKTRGLKKALLMRIEEAALPSHSYDTVLMVGGNFGVVGNPEKAPRLLNKLYGITSDDGIIITSSRNPYTTNNPAHLGYHRKNKLKGRLGGQTKIRIRYAIYSTPWFDYLMVSQEEMQTLLSGTKWEIERFIDSDGANYSAVIRKKP